MNKLNHILIGLVLCMVMTTCNSNNETVDTSLPEPPLTDNELLNLVQEQTLRYFTDLQEPHSGMSRERYHVNDPNLDKNVVTTGGTGFGIMAIIVGIERGFISREKGFEQIKKITAFLKESPRFHGVWSHWLNGSTGDVIPFSEFDDGGDLVETALLVQGLLCARQYFLNGSTQEIALAQDIDTIWKEIEWDFYRGEAREDVLFWHWSENHDWKMNFRMRGYNETFITYVLAASSPTHSIPAEVYHAGWASGGEIVESDVSKPLQLRHQGDADKGGPLFWAHYSFLGLDPNNLEDAYADYWTHNVEHSLLNWQHCVDNPNQFTGYSAKCWGLTASYSINFYDAHSPSRDLGVISPTAALSSFPYTPDQSMAALRHFYENLGGNIWGEYGFYDAFSLHDSWYPKQYLAIDQGPIIVMIENHRSKLLWNLFMSSPEIREGLTKLGFK